MEPEIDTHTTNHNTRYTAIRAIYLHLFFFFLAGCGVRWYIFLGKAVCEEEEERSSSYLAGAGRSFNEGDVQTKHRLLVQQKQRCLLLSKLCSWSQPTLESPFSMSPPLNPLSKQVLQTLPLKNHLKEIFLYDNGTGWLGRWHFWVILSSPSL